LWARLGEEIGERPLVLPTGKYFPDRFTGDEDSVRRLVERMQAHAGISDIPVDVQLVGADGEACGSGSCGTGSCATPATPDDAPVERLVETGDGWRLNVPSAEVASPVVLTTNLARSLSLIFLLETRNESEPIE